MRSAGVRITSAMQDMPYLQKLIQHFRKKDSLGLFCSRGMGRVSLHSLGFALSQAPPDLVQLLMSMQLQLHSNTNGYDTHLMFWDAAPPREGEGGGKTRREGSERWEGRGGHEAKAKAHAEDVCLRAMPFVHLCLLHT